MKTIILFFLAISINLITTACVDDTPYVPRDSIKPDPIKHAPLPPPPPPPPPPAPKVDIIHKVVEHPPRFPGCEDQGSREKKDSCAEKKLYAYIYENLEYPELAIALGVEGVVTLSFVVEKDGKISTVKIVEDIGGGCGEAAVKVIESMNDKGLRWTPMSSRYNVRFLKEVFVEFKLAN